MRMREAVDLIKGEPGTSVTLTLQRDGDKKPFDVTITRALIQVSTVLGDLRKDNESKEWDFLIDKKDRIGYIRLTDFGEKTTEELKAAIKQLEDDGVQGVILDMRNNPGGLLRVAVEVSDLFLTEGLIVSTKGRNYKDEVYRAKLDGTMLQGNGRPVPIVVLINKYSASASEIVAAALQDHGRAVIIGERSYGKGSVQNLLPLEKGQSALKLTTAGYWRPSGKNIHRYDDEKDFKAAGIDPDEWGVRPDKDMELPQTDEERLQYLIYRNERDVVRARAKPAEKDKDGKAKPPFEDKVLNKALEYLRGRIAKAPAPKGDA
jgi:carboxyl-terminal processing protease